MEKSTQLQNQLSKPFTVKMKSLICKKRERLNFKQKEVGFFKLVCNVSIFIIKYSFLKKMDKKIHLKQWIKYINQNIQ